MKNKKVNTVDACKSESVSQNISDIKKDMSIKKDKFSAADTESGTHKPFFSNISSDDILFAETRKGLINILCSGVFLLFFGIFGIFFSVTGSGHIHLKILSAFSLLFSVINIVFGILSLFRQRARMRKYIESFSFGVNNSVRAAVSGFCDPIVVIGLNGTIQWYNKSFSEIFGSKENDKGCFGEKIQNILPNLRVSAFTEETCSVKEYSFNGNTYILHSDVSMYSGEDGSKTLISIYFSDISDIIRLQKQLEDKKTVFCFAVIDNYDEVLKETPNANHGILLGDIERCVGTWVEKGDGVYKRYERDKFIIIFEEAKFSNIASERFSVLNDIKEINQQNKIPVTLSIGVSDEGDNLKENEIKAAEALDMALGRGGDQAVLKTVDGYKFFGARSLGIEKTSKVKARVVADNLCSLMDSVSRVIVMGHRNCDYDSFGAALGLCRTAIDRGKRAYIALERSGCNVEEILPDILSHDEYKECIIGRERAVSLTDKYTLLIIVDTHRRSMTEFPELFEKNAKIAVIDHHRRSEDFIENAALIYHEPYASSTCEMVTEILQHTDSALDISVYEAEALYCGIYMDTKAFTFKTGARTFEAAAYLRKKGVDPVGVKKIFRNDISMYIQKSRVISNARIYRDNIAIAICDESTGNIPLVVAQAADDLLNINGVEASFVLAKIGRKTIISGRSLGAINVQVILEKLGGGGHSTIAGAQLENSGITLGELKLQNAIDEVLFE